MLYISVSKGRIQSEVFHDFKGWRSVARQVITTNNVNTHTALSMHRIIPVIERSLFSLAVQSLIPGAGFSLFHVPERNQIFPGTMTEFKGRTIELAKGSPPFSLLACTYSNDESEIVPFERIERSMEDFRSGLGSLTNLMPRKLPSSYSSGFLGYYVVREGELAVLRGLPEDAGMNGMTGANVWETQSLSHPRTGIHAALFFLNPAPFADEETEPFFQGPF